MFAFLEDQIVRGAEQMRIYNINEPQFCKEPRDAAISANAYRDGKLFPTKEKDQVEHRQ